MVVFASLLGSVWCQRGHYLSPRIDYLPLPFARRMPLFQEVSLIEPRLYAPIIYQSPPQARTDQSLIEDVNKEHSSNEDPITVVSDKEINTIPILSYSNDMAANGGYSYKYETSDGVTREESAVVEQSGDDQDGSTSRTVRGSYSYPSPDGRIISVEYVADRDGFRTTGNHLPAAKMHRAQYVVLK
uniref:Uncharacterized protein n=1 Tax=Rhodnius prolixus TaxID=13249 RepID=T1H8Q1_RHOPR